MHGWTSVTIYIRKFHHSLDVSAVNPATTRTARTPGVLEAQPVADGVCQPPAPYPTGVSLYMR